MNMQTLRWIVAAGICFVMGCSPLSTTVKPVKTDICAELVSKKTVVRNMDTVAIFPLADYSRDQSFLHNPRYGINLKVMEAITDELNGRGISVLNQEDVNGFLVSEGIIAVVKKSSDAASPEWELQKRPHSKLMQANLVHMMSQNAKGDFNDNKELEGVNVGLSKEKVKELGEELGADKIIRGQIIEYGFGETKNLNPMNGWLAVLLGGLAEGSGAFVYQEGYEKGLPDSSWTSKYIYDNELGQGPGANIPPKLTQCFVQLRLYLQDVKTGKIEWSNRTEIKFSPTWLLNYDENQPKNMTDKAIQKGVSDLMLNLFNGAVSKSATVTKEAVPENK
ncbi:MAG TPA: hypothetical protein P5287_04260 [bacterium]|nr:hypothetical protein [bacterium]